MPCPYDTLAVANYFLEKARGQGQGIDPMKLQKLVYYAHGWHLAITGKPLIDEPVEAWPYGPVIPSLYHEFKHYGRQPIGSLATRFDGVEFVAPCLSSGDHETAAILSRIWETYGRLTGVQLSNLSHEDGSPWQITWDRAEKMGKRRGVDIDDELIKSHFEREALRSRPETAAQTNA